MKTLKDHTILYDEVCPMCSLYTRAFQQSGMLDGNGRAAYQQMPAGYTRCVDQKRAADEIALVNRQTGEVHYGIESLFFIIGHAFPFLRPLFRNRLFAWPMRKAYRFISYNRRVIMPSGQSVAAGDPSFNVRYRLAYLACSWLFTAFTLYRYSGWLGGLVPAGNFYRELMVCGGQMIWQWLVVRHTNPGRTWDYLGNMMTVSAAGALLLWPGLLLGKATGAHPVFFAGWFLLVVCLMLAEHVRRARLLQLHPVLSATWVLYRIMILFIIL